MTFQANSVTVAPAINASQSASPMSLSPLTAYLKQCLATVGEDVTLQLVFALHQRGPIDEDTLQTLGDPLEPYYRAPVDTGYAYEFLL